jgi:phenylpropionate dioxygenase-like ring-hydroxylating dioxygenase large terminal subunit
MTTDFENGVTNLVENFMDVPHTVFVHAHWFRNAKRRHGEATCRRTPDDVLITYLHQDDIGFADWALNPERLPMTHTDRFIAPNVTRVDYTWGDRRSFVISSQITPVSPFRSRVYTAIAFRFGLITPLLEPFFRWYTRQVIEQDVVIMRNQGQNLQRHGEARFDATEADWVHRYIEDLREWREGGEQGPAPGVEERRIGFWI